MASDRFSVENSYGLCTWRPVSDCEGCSVRGELNCRFNWNDLSYFAAIFLPFGIAAAAGMIRGGFAWWILGWLGFMAFFFNVWEARVLCSHCPYYGESGHTLHCIANYGVLKVWRFHPEPMSKSEQVQFLVGVLLLLGFPFPFMLLGGAYALSLIALAGAISFAFSLKKQVCSRCINFSCPLNSVPKPIVDAYLRRNAVMREAWEAGGYRLDEEGGS